MSTVDFLSKEGVARIWQAVKDYAISNELLAQPSGVATLDEFGKVLQTQLPDYILGQVLFGGTIDGNGVATLTTLFKNRYNLSVATLDVDNLTAANYEGSYFIATANGVSGIAKTLDIVVGDWVISNGSEWTKIDNTDAVRSVADYVGSITAEELRNRLVGQYKDGNTYKNYALGTMHYADGSGRASQLVSTDFARSILGGIASQSVFNGLYADKAKTLLNKRTIWGQEFDGSGDVRGGISNALYLRFTDSGQYGIYRGKNFNDTLLASDIVLFDTKLIIPEGDVGIGTTSPRARLDVSGTFNARGATTLQSTLLVKDLATFEKSILLANANTIGFKHTDGSNINLLTLTQNNEAQFGYGTIAKGLTSTLYGKKIQFKTKDSLDNDAVIDDNGNFHSYHDISATGGVSASGINDFGIGGSSGGNGGAHYDLLIDQKSDRATFQLKGDDGDIDTKDMLAFSTSRAGIVPNAPSVKSVLFGGGWKALDASDIPSLDWSKIATGKPTTLGGYGITDAYTKSQIENGVFPNMRVGLADDLGDIEETLDEEYTFQPTANPNEIRDGYAKIESLKGNSLVWNQLVSYVGQITSNGVVFSIIDGVVSIKGTAAGTCNFQLFFTTKSNHKYICSPLPSSFTGAGSTYIYNDGFGLSFTTSNRISTANNVSNVYIRVQVGVTVDETFPLQIHDLTQMFGEGNEPTTVEEFYARCPKGMPMDYNEGEVIHFNGDIKSVGFNQWDEEWEVGNIDTTTGLNTINNSVIRSKPYISVFGSTAYYVKTPKNIRQYYYDVNKNYVGHDTWGPARVFTTPANASYMRFVLDSSYDATTYNHDICINISDPDKNGTYEPYTEFRRDLPTELFEGGMKSAGTAHDEVYWDKAKGKYIKVTRIGKVDMGTLSWEYGTYKDYHYFRSSGFVFPSGLIANAIMARYAHSNQNNVLAMADKSFIITQNVCFVVDSAYTDAAAFKAAMQGVMLYYELAEPIVEEIDIPYMDYQVSNSGTEEIVSDIPTTPIKARVTYNFDTIGTVRQNRFDISTIKTTYQPLATAINTSNISSQSVARATADGDGNVIKDTYLKLSGGNMVGNLQIGRPESTENYNLSVWRNVNNQQLRALLTITSKGNVEVSYYNKTNGGYGRLLLGDNTYQVGTTDDNINDLLHSGNTKLTLDPAYNWEDKNSQTNKQVYGFTLNVNGTEIGMSAITKEELEAILV